MITMDDIAANPELQNIPLWVVYGYDSFPSILCCKIWPSRGDGVLYIWGYSVYRNSPGFRTLGQSAVNWALSVPNVKFFDDQDEALAYLKQLTKPKGKALKS